MQIERVKIESLVFDPVNARKHGERNLEAIKGSLAKFGQQKPIVVGEDNVVIAGNGTLEAAKALGWEEIDVHRSVLKGAEAVAFALADNKAGELASWDENILSDLLGSLRADGWEMGDLGFDFDGEEIDIEMGSADGFAEGDQFKDKNNQIIEIKADIDLIENDRFRDDLSAFMERWSLEYKIR